MEHLLDDYTPLCNRNTTITKLTRFSNPSWPSISVKRDDNTDTLLSGNKIRKLEYLIRDAQKQSATCLITCGGFQSNHCRTTAVAAAQLGLQSFILLRTPNGKSPEEPLDGNLFIVSMVGAKIRYCTPEEYKQRALIVPEMIKEVKEKGGVPYVIPEGGSSAVGLLGYISMMKELKDSTYSHIVCAVGSAGTLAGILMGREILNMKHIKVVGIAVCDNEKYFRDEISRLVDEFNAKFNTNYTIGEYELSDKYVGQGYGIPYKEQIECMKSLAVKEGILLDPSYTGKAFYGLVDMMNNNRFDVNDNVLFIHTGGLLGLMAQRPAFHPF